MITGAGSSSSSPKIAEPSRFPKAQVPQTAMGSPPTITVSAGSATLAGALALTLISGSALVTPYNGVTTPPNYRPPFRLGGGTWAASLSTQNFFATAYQVGSIDFDFDGSAFEVPVYLNGSVIRVWVNEQAVALAGTTLANTSNYALVNVNFGSRAVRRIRFEFTGLPNAQPFYFAGVNCLKTDTPAFPAASRGPRLLMVGDSLMLGSGAINAFDGWAYQLANWLGSSEYIIDAIAGTGYVSGSGGNTNYGSAYRLNRQFPVTTLGTVSNIANAATFQPEAILVQSSLNDDTSSATLPAAIASYLTALKAAAPSVPIVVTGVLWAGNGANYGSNTPANNTSIQTAAAAAGASYVDVTEWFTGTGNSGTPNGTGNADYNLYSDLIHPTAYGHAYIGRRMAAELARVIPGLGS